MSLVLTQSYVTDYRHEFPGVECVVRWCLPNPIRGNAPVKAQGFKGQDSRYPDLYWFPDPRLSYNTSLDYVYETLEEARAVALQKLAEQRARLDAAEADIRAQREVAEARRTTR